MGKCCCARGKGTARQEDAMLAQGATEYLVLLAVVLIIALASISLLGFFTGTAGDAQIAESKAYWSGVAYPLRVSEISYIGTGINICGHGGLEIYRMTLHNGGVDPMTLNWMYFRGFVPFFCPMGSGNYTNSVYVAPGETKVFDIGLNTGCEPGETIESDLVFNYTTGHGVRKNQVGTKKLVFKC